MSRKILCRDVQSVMLDLSSFANNEIFVSIKLKQWIKQIYLTFSIIDNTSMIAELTAPARDFPIARFLSSGVNKSFWIKNLEKKSSARITQARTNFTASNNKKVSGLAKCRYIKFAAPRQCHAIKYVRMTKSLFLD